VTTHLHVPSPGELIAPESGSALVTISRALGEAHIARGGAASFIGRAGMPHRTQPMGLLQAAIPDKTWLTNSEKLVDRAGAAALGRWPQTDRLWRPVYEAVPPQHTGPAFLHNAAAAAAGLLRARPRAVPVVYLHNEASRGWPLWTRRRLVKRHRVVCDSTFVADRLVPGAAARGELLVLNNGADIHTFRPATDRPEPTVLFVGKVVPHKGPDLLVEAVRVLFEEGLRFRVRIVGGAVLSAQETLTEFEQRLRLRARPLGDWIRFEPFVDRERIAEVYADATIMVVPSNWDEPCSLTLPEGMAAGLACVASSRGGLREMGGGAPLYFDAPDVAQLADQLRLLLTDEEECGRRAALARARAETLSWDRQLAILVDWLEAEP
jgi:glycosyltransferase involved in cell wall biosynthesis